MMRKVSFSRHTSLLIAAGVVSVIALSSFGAVAQESGTYNFKGGFPSEETAKTIQDEQDFTRALEAYRFFYPVVSMAGMMEGAEKAGVVNNKAAIIMSANPKQIGLTLNSDTPYGTGGLDLAKGPMVIEVPAGPYIGLVDDHFHRWITDMGIPGPDAGKGGKYLILPPDYKGAVPEGYHATKSPTYNAIFAIRSLPVDGDLDKALNNLKNFKIYPLADAANPAPYKFTDVTDKAINSSSLPWEDNLTYWEKLSELVNAEPMPAEFSVMYGYLSALGIEKGKSFNPDARMKDILTRAAKEGRDRMLVEAFASNRPDRMAWKDRRWEWASLRSENGDFLNDSGMMDIVARERWFIQAIVASPAMFRRQAGGGSLYWLGHRDRGGEYVDGGKTYKLHVPGPVPAKLFWSVTVYDPETRSEIVTDQNKAALRSLTDKFAKNADGSIDLYFGPEAPAGKEAQWIKTIPGKGWFSYFRIYGPEEAAFNGQWKPADFEEVKAKMTER